ncbi:lysophospholipid acyltransferase family protein [Inhella sp.]|uniref:lysophospholipid acyltransferase family protein n=1 Tax=Inhella sp. TaxID=1921806 RepID=UPI0035B00EB7
MNLLRGIRRLLRLLGHVLVGLAVLALLFPRRDAMGRQWHIQRWSAGLLRCLGVELNVRQQAAVPPACLVVCNHVSWLDIACVHAALPQARFVSKADVRHWPLLGWMVAAAGTLFIEREKKRDALRVVHHCAEALKRGDTVAVFPEGTTGAGPELLPFHANLLQAAVSVDAPLQPLALRFHTARERFATEAQFIGDTTLLQSLWRVASAQGLRAELTLLPSIDTQAMDRRALAEMARERIQASLFA